MTDPIRVFLVDDHAIVRRGLGSYLDGEDDMEVIGQADNGRHARDEIAVLATSPAGLPDVVLMDLLMPDVDGIAATTELTARWPTLKVIAVTSFLEEEKVRAALDAGAVGYLLKDAQADDVADAIRTVTTGDVVLPPAVARTLLAANRRPAAPTLTTREREVITLIAAGHTNQQIARRLAVSERTARTHVSNILSKLGLSSRTQAALWAERNGLSADTSAAP